MPRQSVVESADDPQHGLTGVVPTGKPLLLGRSAAGGATDRVSQGNRGRFTSGVGIPEAQEQVLGFDRIPGDHGVSSGEPAGVVIAQAREEPRPS